MPGLVCAHCEDADTPGLPDAKGHHVCNMCWDAGCGYRPVYTEPEYRVERYAQDAENTQIIVNFLRRLFWLPIRRDPAEEADKVRRSYLRDAQ